MIGFSLLWWVLLLCSTKSNNNVLYFSLVFFLSIVVGFRGIEVCPDTQTYEVIYNSVVVDKDYTYTRAILGACKPLGLCFRRKFPYFALGIFTNHIFLYFKSAYKI